MKKHFFILSLIFSIFTACNNAEYECLSIDGDQAALLSSEASEVDFFWYRGEKHYLIPDRTKSFVVYNDTNACTSADVLDEGLYSNVVTSKTKSKQSAGSIQKWQIVRRSGYPATKSLSARDASICYESPYYISAKSGKPVGVSNLIHIKLNKAEDIDILKQQMNKYHLSIFSQNEFMPLWYTLTCNDNSLGNSLQICNTLHNTELFAIVEPDFMTDLSMAINAFQIPNDSYYNRQWNLHGDCSINWPEASTISKGENVRIGLIDQGVAFLHPDLDPSLVLPAYDASIDGGAWYANGYYGPHGTNCAGIIAAQVNNNLGIAGICPKVTVNSYSDPLTKRPNASQNLASDLYLALTSEDVVSCSWGSNDLISSEISDAINFYGPWGRDNKGTVLVFASGNNFGSVCYPANLNPYILVVGASDQNGQKAAFSNYGEELDVVAPGVDVTTLTFTSTSTYSYSLFSGTSAACPHVAAVAAMILSVNPNLTNIEVNDIIEKSARKVGGYTYSTNVNRPNGLWNQYMGYGLVDATAALKAAQESLLN